jgi:hypothetical protein
VKQAKDGEYPLRPMPISLDKAISIYGVFRDYVKHEDGLINYRLTWLLTINGFLYATYGLTIHKKLEVAQKIADVMREHPNLDFECYVRGGSLAISIAQIELFLLGIIFVGIIISTLGLVSIVAAQRAAVSVRNLFHGQYKSIMTSMYGAEFLFVLGNTNAEYIVVPSIVGGGKKRLDFHGFLSPVAIPIILIVSWIFAAAYSVYYITINQDFAEHIFLFHQDKACTHPILPESLLDQFAMGLSLLYFQL